MIKQIGLPLRGRPILLITRMITDRIGLHSVLLPLLILGLQPHNKRAMLFDKTAQIVFTEFAGKKSSVLSGGIVVDLFSYVVNYVAPMSSVESLFLHVLSFVETMN